MTMDLSTTGAIILHHVNKYDALIFTAACCVVVWLGLGFDFVFGCLLDWTL